MRAKTNSQRVRENIIAQQKHTSEGGKIPKLKLHRCG